MYCQGKSGQVQRFESTAWLRPNYCVLLFPNKKKPDENIIKEKILRGHFCTQMKVLLVDKSLPPNGKHFTHAALSIFVRPAAYLSQAAVVITSKQFNTLSCTKLDDSQ